jgi:hypothetical protein
MRSLKSGLVAVAISGLFVGLAIAGCTADGGGADLGTDQPATDPSDNGGAQLPPPSQSSSGGSGPVDAGKKDSGKSDAAVDAGPPPPDAGDPCTKADDVATRPCGACGTQQALCTAADDAGALKWSDYGVCSGEVAGGCIPGTVTTEACGNCGTLTKTCTKYCAYTSSTCSGQPTNACTPSAIDYSTAGCSTPNTYRNRTCSGTCQWSAFSGTCAAPNNPNKMTISGTVGQVVSQQWTLSASTQGHKPSDCGGSASSTNVQYVAVEVKNNTAQKATVSIYQTKAPSGSELDTLIWVYNKTLPPQDDTTLVACDYGVEDSCSSTVPANLCANASSYNLAGLSNVTINAGASVLVYSSGYSSSVTGPFILNVKTDLLQ